MNGVTEEHRITGIAPNTTIEDPKLNLTKEGFEFVGWYEDLQDPDPWDFENDLVDRDLTLHAKWKETSYTITYNANTGAAIPVLHLDSVLYTQASDYKVLAREATGFTNLGYDFMGWSLSKNGPVQYQAGSPLPIADNATVLYAVWKPLSYDVTYDVNGGKGSASPVSVEYNKNHAVLSIDELSYSYAGKTFVEWTTQQDGGGERYQPRDPLLVKGDVTLMHNGRILLIRSRTNLMEVQMPTLLLMLCTTKNTTLQQTRSAVLGSIL